MAPILAFALTKDDPVGIHWDIYLADMIENALDNADMTWLGLSACWKRQTLEPRHDNDDGHTVTVEVLVADKDGEWEDIGRIIHELCKSCVGNMFVEMRIVKDWVPVVDQKDGSVNYASLASMASARSRVLAGDGMLYHR